MLQRSHVNSRLRTARRSASHRSRPTSVPPATEWDLAMAPDSTARDRILGMRWELDNQRCGEASPAVLALESLCWNDHHPLSGAHVWRRAPLTTGCAQCVCPVW
jgi:hypothetical protein